MGFSLGHKRRNNFFDLVKASKVQNVTKYCYEYRRKKFKMCPNTAWNIDQYFTKMPISMGFRVGKNEKTIFWILQRYKVFKMLSNTARNIDVKSAKCVETLLGIWTNISQKKQTLRVLG